ncbi:enoyl-CoA hydratase/isomerase family protein [Rhodococcoides kyotonense]|uniref:Probable enoyl-CoA hydratase EchA17 n=1 Tax=Rhodococcoides kyotonense TaxID=398843 RepID=A0A239MSE0_9NOCA|nr:enoyl-CoA hydratase/isomerase family protein [Rhodococcus kyotonensis]SNT45014.1 Enoyl-CoA hydratase/carnithine racemase [Rhodococcus kyotonensis]
MSEIFVRLDRSGPVATLTLDNPPLNVVTLGLTRQLSDHLDALAIDPEVRAVVITGAGSRAFCAGSDITEFTDMMEPGQVVDKKLRRQNEIFSFLANYPKPTVAALNGLTFGGGLEIALCCDLLVADESIRLALPEIKLGVFPSSGGTFRATRRIGVGRAKRLILLGEPVDTATALDWGLIDYAVPAGTAVAAAQNTAATLATRPTYALELAKSVIDMADDATEQVLIEASLAASDQAFSSPECREGVRAFLAKETPDFEHHRERT